ncbi:TIR domain-containing protein, partial [Ideonella sp.]|uniref:TIR domain-containing protein n=1 Tax=Ideonella sp. TaxID=1929293 RepID=UPI003BB66FC4
MKGAAYQVALSFAGEDRPYVSEVAAHLAEHGVKVFYDEYERVSLWGKDLYTHLSEIYRVLSEY